MRRPRRLAAAAAVLAGALGVVLFRRAALVAPEPTVLLLDRRGGFLGEVPAEGDERLGFWAADPLPHRVAAATLAVEDRRFRRHPGVDPLALARAAWQNLRAGRRTSGASTVAMQVARLQRPGPRTFLRKGLEALTALALVARHGRDAVLAHYLRIVPYGNRLHGIAYAARRYFDKPVEDLSWAEVAFLAALPQAPGRMNPYLPEGRLRAAARGRRILAALRDRGELTAAEHDLAVRQIAGLQAPPLPRRSPEAIHAVLRLAARVRSSPGGSPLVRTTLDPDLQEEVAWRTFEAVRDREADGVGNAAAVVLELPSGRVLALCGSSGYFDAGRAGAIDYTAVARPAGSTLKPFVYALALDRGAITPATVLDDSRRGPGGIENADFEFYGPLLPRFALANSRNVPAVEVLRRAGRGEVWTFLRDLGLHDGAASPRELGDGLALGVLPVSLERLVRAYTALAGDGLLREPVWFEGQPQGAPQRVLSEEAARQVALFLSDPMARLPGFPRMGPSEYPFAAAVKTGTSAGCRDAWAVAWSRRALVGVWMGRPDYRPMRGVSGFGSAAVLARRILALRHPDQLQGLDDRAFPPPRGYRLARLCAASGRSAGPRCPRVAAEWLPAAADPGFCDGDHGWRGAPPPPVFTLQDAPPALRVASPEPGTRLLADPEVPPGMATIALEAEAPPSVPQLVWYVDGLPFAVADRPFTARWPLSPGRHTFEVRLPHVAAASPPVGITVQ